MIPHDLANLVGASSENMVQEVKSARAYGVALWCVRKHLSLAYVHLQETAQKLYKDCDNTSCKLSSATMFEADLAMRNLLAAEEHLSGEVISKIVGMGMSDFANVLRDLADEIRTLRQKLVTSGVIFKPESSAYIRDLIDMFTSQVNELIAKVDQYSEQFKQEQMELYGACHRCAEDLSVEISGAIEGGASS